MTHLKRFKRVLLVASATVICLGVIAYIWTSHHIWFPLGQNQVLVNGNNLGLSDYLPGRSLNGDIFLRNQDHGTQYLISPKKKEVSVISGDAHFIDIGLFTYTRDDLVDVKYPSIKRAVSNPSLIVGNRFVEFTSLEGQHWRIAY
jgi:hypothetical protein